VKETIRVAEILARAILLGGLLAISSPVQAETPLPLCDELAPWQVACAKAAASSDLPSLSDRNAAFDLEEMARRAAATRIYERYQQRRSFSGKALEECLANNPERGNFLLTLNDVFVSQTFALLEGSQSSGIKSLLKLANTQFSGKAPLIQTVSSSTHPQDLPYAAGFHRGSGSITLDFDAVGPEEWPLIFAHELLHAVDPQILVGMADYADPTVPALLAKRNQTVKTLSALSSDEQLLVEKWIRAGLDRGLFAEYRAWVPSLLIYQQGKEEGLWPAIPWLEQVLALKKPTQALSEFTYLYLDARSPDPSSGIFSLPLTQDALHHAREKIRSTHAFPDLGLLGAVR
jgi:hypothetical protein